MKITKVTPLRINRYCFVEIETDEGITGLGEGGAFGGLDAMAAQISHYGEYLVGKNPLDIELHWQVMFRGKFFRGAISMAAISAIDIALWDIAGKYHQCPVYELLGGKCRNKIRVYGHVFAKNDQELVEGIQKRVEEGFTAIGHLSPFLDEPMDQPYEKTHAEMLEESYERVGLMRRTAGNKVDLCIEMHRRLGPGEALQLIDKLAEFDPLFVEDPIAPGNHEAMGWLASHSTLPIATGERLHTYYDFLRLLQEHGACYIRPSVTTCGGITGAKKIAGLAEAFMCKIVPHNPPISPVGTAAALQLCANVDNMLICEYPDPKAHMLNSSSSKAELVENFHAPIAGYIEVPKGNGIDIKLNEDAKGKFPAVSLSAASRLNADGSVRDQ